MIGLFSSPTNAWSQIFGRDWPGHHACHQEVGRCHTRGESQGCMLLPSANKGAHSDFETQRRCHQKSKTGKSVAPQKGLMSPNKLKQKKNFVVNFLKIIFLQLSACLDTFSKTDKEVGNGRNHIAKLGSRPKQECEDDCRNRKNCVGYDYNSYQCYHYYTVPTKWFKYSGTAYYSREKCYRGRSM